MNRHRVLPLVLIGALAAWVAGLIPGEMPALADDEWTVLPETIDGVAPKNMMRAELMRRIVAALDRREVEYENLKTPEQLAAYQQRLRRFFVETLGGFPERTPLRPRVVAAREFDDYRMEKVIYESQPGHYVTAVVYLPKTPPPYPGVLVPCGHSANGKASETYQRVSILLARNGLAALCYDPIDQGERFQLLAPDGKPIVGGTTGHTLLNVGSILLGRNTATFRIWDGMRSLDYLAQRDDIDPKRLGCTGNSGGGTLTSYLMALDERIAVAAPSCYLTTFRRLLETIGPQDGEQNLFGQLGQGMDHADYVLLRAPRPTLICAATRDFFDIGGTWQTFRQAKRFYGRLGFPERVDLVETDEPHGFSSLLRVGSVRWMRRWLLGIDDAVTEPQTPILKDEELQCTPEGQVMRLAGARSVYDINADEENEWARRRAELWRDGNRTAALAEVRRVTGIRPLAELPEPRATPRGSLARDGYRVDKLMLDVEPGIHLPALLFVPEKPSGEATLYLHADGKHADAAPDGPIVRRVRDGMTVMAVDLRGLGETLSDGRDYGVKKYLGPDWEPMTYAYLLGTSYLAMRSEDVIVCARLLGRRAGGHSPRKVHLVAVGGVVPPALHAAALEPELFDTITLRGGLASWRDVVRTPLAMNQYANVVHGALRVYDLPDLLAALPAEKVAVLKPVDALGRPLAQPEATAPAADPAGRSARSDARRRGGGTDRAWHVRAISPRRQPSA